MARRKKTKLELSELSEKKERALQLYEQVEIGMIARTECGRSGIITEKFFSIGGMPHVWMQEFMSSVPTPEPTEFIVEIMPTSSPLPIVQESILQGSIDEKLPYEPDPPPLLPPQATLILPLKPTLLELFAGGGGVAAGAIDAGIEPIIAVEFDPSKPELSSAIADCHEQNFPNCQVIRQTVQDVASLGFSGFPTEPNILVATPVCSSFSPAKNGTEQPEDIVAAKAVAAAIKALKPRHFLLENVPAYQNSQSWLLIESQLYLLGYRVAASVVDMSDYGIPQARRRLIVRAARDYEEPILLPPLQPKVGWYDAISDLIPNLLDSSLLPGQQKSLDEYLRNNEPTPLLIDRVGGRGEYRLVPADKPSKTILRSHFTDGNGRNRNKFADIRLPDGTVKSLSIECIRRLQGFPDWYKFPNSVAVAGSILGYAVPPKFVEMLLKNLTVASDSETATPNNQFHQPTNSINQLIPLTVDSNSEKVISHEPTAISPQLTTNNGQQLTTNNGQTLQIPRNREKTNNQKDKISGLSISFGKTLPQLLSRQKAVTRRVWCDSYASKFISAYSQDLKVKALDTDYRYGGKQIGWLKLTSEPCQERIGDMPESELAVEGFPELSKEEFIERFFDNNPDLLVWAIRFEFTPFADYKGNEELLGNDQLPTTSGNEQLSTTSGNDQLPTTGDLKPEVINLPTTDDLKPEVINLPTTDDLKPEVINLPTTDDLKPEVISQNYPTNSQEWLNISEIHRDGGTQPRAFLDLKHVAILVEVLEDGGELDPVTVFYDGAEYWLADGFHRCKAHEDFGQEEINCTIVQGTRRDAVLYSVGANAEHKAVKPRSREDKRRAVTMLLNDPEWKEWSDREIARQCKVHNSFVSRLRQNLTVASDSEKINSQNLTVASDSEKTNSQNLTVASDSEKTNSQNLTVASDSEKSESKERTYTTKHGTKSKMRTGNIGRGDTKEKLGSVVDTPPLSSPPPSINDYLIGFLSNIEEMSVGQLEEAQRRIDQRLKRQSDVNELNAQLNAIAIERDQFKTEVEAIAIERDQFKTEVEAIAIERDQFKTEVELRESRIEALLQEIEQLKTRPTRQSSREVSPEQVQEVMG